jgi:hypothetical protein
VTEAEELEALFAKIDDSVSEQPWARNSVRLHGDLGSSFFPQSGAHLQIYSEPKFATLSVLQLSL